MNKINDDYMKSYSLYINEAEIMIEQAVRELVKQNKIPSHL